MKLLMSTVRDCYALRIVDPLTTHGTEAEVVQQRYKAFDEMLNDYLDTKTVRITEEFVQARIDEAVQRDRASRRSGW